MVQKGLLFLHAYPAAMKGEWGFPSCPTRLNPLRTYERISGSPEVTKFSFGPFWFVITNAGLTKLISYKLK